jgi:hypothetical protein
LLQTSRESSKPQNRAKERESDERERRKCAWEEREIWYNIIESSKPQNRAKEREG